MTDLAALDQDGRVSVAIFAARENIDVLSETIEAALVATRGEQATCDILINGNSALCQELEGALDRQPPDLQAGQRLRVFFISVPDKSFTWNTYIHLLWDPVSIAFFVDGYARVEPDAIRNIKRDVLGNPAKLAGTGVPSVGRGAAKAREEMLLDGGIQGNLYALRGSVVERLKQIDFRLPLGIYRTDPTLGGVLAYNLDPANDPGDMKRIHVSGDATWTFEPLSPWRLKDIWTHLKRRSRQKYGHLEITAVRTHLAIRKRPPEDLPRTGYHLVTGWVRENPKMFRAMVLKNPRYYFVFKKFKPFPHETKMAEAWRLVREFFGA